MVFRIAIIIVILFVTWGAIAPDSLSATTTSMLNFTTERFGWFYLIATFFFLVFAFSIAFSRYGKIKLGSDEDEPEYSNSTWFAMLFSAGMGIGLVFWGVAEPINHYMNPPLELQGKSIDAARVAMPYAFFHWGLHPWAIYAVMALSLAYFKFRKGAKGLISATFYPLLGERVNGPIGKTIDVLAIFATAFGVATSLGFGVLQINGGLTYLFGLPATFLVQAVIIAIVTVLFLLSAQTGLDRGIKTLSNVNLLFALCLLLFTLLLGPTSFIFDTFTTSLGNYLNNLVQMSMRMTPYSQGKWIQGWTLFYWAWWIAWAPFVGMFIARVSKGRTIREFMIGVLLVPSLLSFIWFSVFGGTALEFELFRGYDIVESVKADMTSALFSTLHHLPLGTFLAGLATLLIITFFITSADSATFVLGMFSSKGDLNPSNRVKLTWGVLQSLIALVLLYSGGLEALQTASIVTALPFAVILVLMCWSVLKALEQEDRERRKKERERQKKLDALLLDQK
ncbi:glycine betaine uptake BCCT transporter [Tumebacillus lipolyticus]|uniref:BCCT family transporter n=1 Tax=Tumebacillus lipolyticus TaxID=1280370 RepID=A0ABW4ZZ71_9BACL